MLQTVRWTTDKRLSCTGVVPAQVVLHLARNIVLPQQCDVPPELAPSTETHVPYQFTMVSAEISQVLEYRDNCGVKVYRYTFSYDTGQILPGETIFTEDIQAVFCRGALTQWVTEQAGNDVTLAMSGNEYVLTNQHGCKYAFPYVDPALSSKIVREWTPVLAPNGVGTIVAQTILDAVWEEFADWAWFQLHVEFEVSAGPGLISVEAPFPAGAPTAITSILPLYAAALWDPLTPAVDFAGWGHSNSAIIITRHTGSITAGVEWQVAISGKIQLTP